MAENMNRYLDLISQHLQENHAALFIGAGFSLNADKATPDVPNMPLWKDLAEKFKDKLGGSEDTDPLTLAENVEIAYGRHELDQLLLDSINDADYLPSPLYNDLLRLPWSDVFTTNYDTLLERAAEKVIGQPYKVITNKSDLVGSSGRSRIVKLHGSFPSQRPFIITSEDYRTYPTKFAPFVNTVQQSMLENTLCLIGFSGTDPNFNNWVGWIRDNLGDENAPQIYLLTHKHLPDVQQQRLRKRNIIVVELQECFPDIKQPYEIYRAAFEYLWKQYITSQEGWRIWKAKELNIYAKKPTFSAENNIASPAEFLPIKDVFLALQQSRQALPNTLFLSKSARSQLRSFVLSPAKQFLAKYCNQDITGSEVELDYLYEYDQLYAKTLLPLFDSDIKLYQKILELHPKDYSEKKLSVQLSLLRSFRIGGNFEEWKKLHAELAAYEPYFTQELRNQLKWETCLYKTSQYEFQQLRQELAEWKVSPNMPLWALRKAGLLAEYADASEASGLLQSALLNLRRHMDHQSMIDRFLLSLESAMMELQDYIAQAEHFADCSISPKAENQDIQGFAKRQRQALHRKYEVSWEDENTNFVPRLEGEWSPFRSHQTKAGFDFGSHSTTTYFGDDKNVIDALTFLRFREETGIPFRIGYVQSDSKAADGAAERIARYYPDTAILTIVRTNNEKVVERAVTRGILSLWTQEDADQYCQLYIDALEQALEQLPAPHWPRGGTFAERAANVLPEVLSELCSKCSDEMMEKLLALLKDIYCSGKKEYYPKAASLANRLLLYYPAAKRSEMLQTLLSFPLKEGERPFDLPDPFSILQISSTTCRNSSSEVSYPEIETWLALLTASDKEQPNLLDRLLYCSYQGLLTDSQKTRLGDFIWNNGNVRLSNHWLLTVCLDLPAQQKEDEVRWVSQKLVEQTAFASGNTSRIQECRNAVLTLMNFSLFQANTFESAQVTAILRSLLKMITSLMDNIDSKIEIMGLSEFSAAVIYESLHTLWFLTVGRTGWTPAAEDREVMTNILSECRSRGIRHYGVERCWCPLLGEEFSCRKELERSLHSTNEKRAYYVYEVLAAALRYPEKNFLSEEELHIGVSTAAQQIAWGTRKHMVHALQVVTLAADADILNEQDLEWVMSGLSPLLEQSAITPDDTIEEASDKGIIRRNAVSLSRKLPAGKLSEYNQDILRQWQAIGQDKDEFAEIRTAP